LNGRVRVRQPARGYRVNVDTLLLAAAVEAAPQMRLMEAGCGVAAALLAVAVRSENTKLVGVERDTNIASIARENVAIIFRFRLVWVGARGAPFRTFSAISKRG